MTIRSKGRVQALAAVTALLVAVGAAALHTEHPPSRQARVSPASATSAVPLTTADPPTTTTASVATTTTAKPPPPTTTTMPHPPAPAGDVEDAILRAFGPDVYPAALRVARCESGLNPAASEHGTHVGLFQLSTQYHQARAARLGFTWQQVSTEAWPNAAVAADLYREQGWHPWTCKP